MPGAGAPAPSTHLAIVARPALSENRRSRELHDDGALHQPRRGTHASGEDMAGNNGCVCLNEADAGDAKGRWDGTGKTWWVIGVEPEPLGFLASLCTSRLVHTNTCDIM